MDRHGGAVLHFDNSQRQPREIPDWMVSAEYCSSTELGSPLLSIDALNKLRHALDVLITEHRSLSDEVEQESLDEEIMSETAKHRSTDRSTGKRINASGRNRSAGTSECVSRTASGGARLKPGQRSGGTE